MHPEEEEEELSFWEKRVSDEEDVGRRIEAVTEGETGDLMRSASEREFSLVV